MLNGWQCTIRANRGGPKSITSKKSKILKTMKRGDYSFAQSTITNIICTTWIDNKKVSVLSNIPTGDAIEVTERRLKFNGTWVKGNFNRPRIIGHYNTYMGGVDLADKKITTYKKHMKGIHWPLKVFWYFIDVAITNAHYIHMKVTNSKNTLREFREQLSTQLVGNRSYCKMKPCTAAGDQAIRFNSSLPHAPQGNPKRRCAVHQQRCDTKYSCAVCGVYMCVDPCYARYHYKVDYLYNDPTKVGKPNARKKK